MSNLFYKPGTILLLATGEYSDSGYEAQIVTLCELDMRAELAAWRKALGKNGDGDWVADDWDHGASDFVAHLICTQKVAPLECQTLHIGSYGRVDF